MLISVAQYAALLGRKFTGDGSFCPISFASLGRANPDQLAFCEGDVPLRELQASRAGVLLIDEKLFDAQHPRVRACILSDDPYGDMERLMVRLFRHPLEDRAPSIAPSAQIHPTAVVEGVVEAGAKIGPHCWVARGSRIGSCARLEANVSVYPRVDVGERCVLLAGAVVGSRGFGFRRRPDGTEAPVEHRAGVVLGPDCLIGANSVVAAGFVEPTTLGAGVCIDSSVQVAHNVRIGDRSMFAAHVDLAGHCTIGSNVRMGGGAQVAGGVTVGDGATLLASAGATKDVPPGEVWSGFPARPVWEWRRSVAALHDSRRKAPDSSD
ncbi:MAG: UDP-3-O-(3-hydroxymyristoyl)glucosamine N-acyltransferase [Fibrobacterales bacterium]|nr:UDP-3-O-(3-hydroxymyristoyl)glucosamine N-acyltransferase [Fibrobacterales bacterium]MBP5188710.1 UDP-3-O-(3-hydroxymyristoyl)glucosamine N-acyltransferase [Fibrobacterales bacterium]MBP5351644.1 UDP-3-O-(3-hydroxymyristoyl)glucosamine N-acyltransferase [Fibrobacterales bacterium]